MSEWDKKQKNTLLGTLLRLIPLLILILLIEAAVVIFWKYTFVDWKPISVDAISLDWRNQGITHVSGLSRCKDLQAIDLRGNWLDPAEVRQLQESLPGCSIRWDIPLDDGLYDSAAQSLELTDVPANWENLLYFQDLQNVHISRCTRYDLLNALQGALPHCNVSWNVDVGGQWIDSRMTWLKLDGKNADYDTLAQQLSRFPALEKVEVENVQLSFKEQSMLLNRYPDIDFFWSIGISGKLWDNQSQTLTYGPGDRLDVEELESALDFFPRLKTLDLIGCDLTTAAVNDLRRDHPELDILWEVEFAGQTISCDATEIDFSGTWLGSSDGVEALFRYLPRLERVILCDCGIPNEELDALNRRYEDIKVIWRVYFANYSLRTDATSFIAAAYEDGADIYNHHAAVFKYLTDLQGLDLGHMYIDDLSFLQYMPHMQYLILAECPIRDISYLSYCKELKYLEIFHTYIKDISPLLECKNLEDLNLSYTDVTRENAWEVLSQMTWLDRLWYCSPSLNTEQIRQLQELLPECDMFMKRGAEPTGNTWRYHEHYYAMRDLFGMYYMPGGTNGMDEDGNQIIVDDYGRQYTLEGWEGNPNWWEDYGIDKNTLFTKW